MFTTATNRIPTRRRRVSAGVTIVVSLLFALVLNTSAGASTAAFSGGITPAGAVPTKAGTKVDAKSTKHGMGALLPKKRVNPILPPMLASTLPTSVDLSNYSVPVGNQGQIDSCVAWAIDHAMLGWYSRRYNKAGQPFHPMYTYSQIHLDNSAGGGGSWPNKALDVALNQGNDTTAHYTPASLTDFSVQPDASERANAASWKISGYTTLFANTTGAGFGTTGSTQIKTALANGQPVAIAMQVRSGFNNVSRTANTLWDDITSPVTGGHEVLAIGYDQYGLWIQNSWDTTWGYNGYGRLSWRVVGNDVYQAHTISGFAASSTPTDTTPPTVSAPVQQIDVPNTITSTTVPVKLTWTASDASGIAAVELWTSTNGGAYVRDTTVTTQTQRTYALTVGSQYKFAVRAKDSAGNWSGYAYSVPMTPSLYDDKSFSIPGWTRYSLTGTYGGTYLGASAQGSWIEYTFTGRDIALIGPKFSTAGSASLYCDGTSFGSVGEYSSTTVTGQTIAWCHFAQSGQHKMKFVVQGNGRFGVDAFAVLS